MSKIEGILLWLRNHPKLTGLVTGIMLGSTFVWPVFAPVTLFGVLLSIYLLDKIEAPYLPVVLTLAFGTKALLALSWFLSAYPITWLFELSPSTQLIVVFIYWGICTVFLSSAGVVLALLWRFCRRWSWRVYLIPLLWVLAEYFGAVIFSIFSAGPGSYITGAFSFGHIGYVFTWLTPVALFGGAYVVGIVGLFIMIAFYQFLKTRQWKPCVGVLVGVCMIFFMASQSLEHTRPTAHVVLVNTNFDSQVADEVRAAALKEMIEAALQENPDYIALPEDARYLYQYQLPLVGARDAVAAWQIFHPTSTAVMIDSGRTTDDVTGAVVQRAYVWGEGEVIYTADKQYLVPQGEFMPSLAAFTLRFVGFGQVADALSTMINYTASKRVVDGSAPSDIPNMLFCFESVSPLAAKRLVDHRPSDFIVHPMSHSWFHDPVVVWRQLDTMLRYQAVYAQTPIVSVGNEIRGQVYLPDGSVEQEETIATFPWGTIDKVK